MNVAADVLSRDPALPGLGGLLPRAGVPEPVASFAAGLRPDADPARARVVYVRYRPTRSCVALFEFPTPEAAPFWVYVRHLPAGRSRRVADEGWRRLAARVEAACGHAPWRLLPEAGLLLYAFPLDPRLPQLPRADDRAWLEQSLAPRLGLGPRAKLVGRRALSYKPERRCVFHYRFEGPDGNASCYAKLFRDDRGQALAVLQGDLGRQLSARATPWRVVVPSAWLPEARMLVFPELAGEKVSRRMRAVVEGRDSAEDLMRHAGRAARGLSQLQACRLRGLPEVPPRASLERFGRDADRVSRVRPELAEAVRKRLARLEAACARLPAEPLVPTHGAFRHGQLLLARDATVVLDFDTLCLSGASADAGNFLAYLELTGLRRPRLRAVLEKCREAFLEGLPSGGLAPAPWLAWHHALSLVKVTLRSFLSLDPVWPTLSESLLRGADEALSRLPGVGRASC